MENKSTLYIIGGGIVLVILFVLMRRGGSSPTVIQTAGAYSGTNDNGLQSQLASQAIQADVFKSLAAGAFGSEANRYSSQLGMSQISANRDIGLAQAAAASEVARAQNLVQSQAISAARDVGIAQAGADVTRAQLQNAADLTRAQLQNEALRSQQRSAATNNALTGLLSNLGNILRALGKSPTTPPTASKPPSSGGGGGSSGGGGSPSSTSRPPPPRRLPGAPIGVGAGTLGIGAIETTPPFVPYPEIPYLDVLGYYGLDFPEIPFFEPSYGTYSDFYNPQFDMPDNGLAGYGYLADYTAIGELEFFGDVGSPAEGQNFGEWFESVYGPPPEYGNEESMYWQDEVAEYAETF